MIQEWEQTSVTVLLFHLTLGEILHLGAWADLEISRSLHTCVWWLCVSILCSSLSSPSPSPFLFLLLNPLHYLPPHPHMATILAFIPATACESSGIQTFYMPAISMRGHSIATLEAADLLILYWVFRQNDFYHFLFFLLVKTDHRASPDPKRREKDLTSLWEIATSHWETPFAVRNIVEAIFRITI